MGLFGGGGKKPKYTPIDINKLMTEARTQYAENWKQSVAMAKGVNPGLDSVANQTSAGFKARNSFLSDLMGGNGDLLNEASTRTLQQLRLGGKLDPETQNAVMRGALSQGAGAGLSGSGAGRGLAARDLGLTSLGLQQSRTDRASAMGNLMQQLGLSKFNAGAAAAAGDVGAAGMVANIYGRPESGLDPLEVAGLKVKENSTQNEYGVVDTMMGNQQAGSNLQAMLGLGTTLAGTDWSSMFKQKPAAGKSSFADPFLPTFDAFSQYGSKALKKGGG